MVVNDKDKELETPQPQDTPQPTTPTPTNSLEYLALANKANADAHWGMLDTMGERVAQRNAEIEQAQKNRDESLRKANEARENHTSTLGALWQKQKPEYDEDRAKRVRNNAIIQSFGDMMNAALRGYFAFRPQGAGVYPNISENSPLKNIEELNRMREQYLKRNEEWKNLGYEIEESEAEAKVKAAESLAKLMDAEYKEALKRGENAEEALQSAYEAALKAQYEGNKAIATAWGKEEAEGRRDARAKYTADRADARAAAQIASRTSGSEKADNDDEEVYDVVNAVEALYGESALKDMDQVTTSVKPHEFIKGKEVTTTSTRKVTWGNLTDAQRKNLYHKYKDDPRAKLYAMGVNNGTLGNAAEEIKSLSDEQVEYVLIVAGDRPTMQIGDIIRIVKE